MNQAKSDFIIVGCLDDVETKQYQRIPRHVTIVPWFSMPYDVVPDLIKQLGYVVAHHPELTLKGGSEDYFGPQHDMLVRKIADPGEIIRLHVDCLSAVLAIGGMLRRPEYTGDHYQPHITQQEDGWLGEGESRTIARVQVFQAIETDEAKRDLIQQFSFGSSDEN